MVRLSSDLHKTINAITILVTILRIGHAQEYYRPGSPNRTMLINKVQADADTSWIAMGNGRWSNERLSYLSGTYSGLSSMQNRDMSMSWAYEHNTLGRADLRGSITRSITGGGYVDLSHLGRLVDGSTYPTLFTVLTPSSVVVLTFTLPTNVSSDQIESWQPFIQVSMSNPPSYVYTYPESVLVEVSSNGTSYYSAAGWSTSSFSTESYNGLWVGTFSDPPTVGVWKYARFTLRDFVVGTTNYLYIHELGLRHPTQPTLNWAAPKLFANVSASGSMLTPAYLDTVNFVGVGDVHTTRGGTDSVKVSLARNLVKYLGSRYPSLKFYTATVDTITFDSSRYVHPKLTVGSESALYYRFDVDTTVIATVDSVNSIVSASARPDWAFISPGGFRFDVSHTLIDTLGFSVDTTLDIGVVQDVGEYVMTFKADTSVLATVKALSDTAYSVRSDFPHVWDLKDSLDTDTLATVQALADSMYLALKRSAFDDSVMRYIRPDWAVWTPSGNPFYFSHEFVDTLGFSPDTTLDITVLLNGGEYVLTFKADTSVIATHDSVFKLLADSTAAVRADIPTAWNLSDSLDTDTLVTREALSDSLELVLKRDAFEDSVSKYIRPDWLFINPSGLRFYFDHALVDTFGVSVDTTLNINVFQDVGEYVVHLTADTSVIATIDSVNRLSDVLRTEWRSDIHDSLAALPQSGGFALKDSLSSNDFYLTSGKYKVRESALTDSIRYRVGQRYYPSGSDYNVNMNPLHGRINFYGNNYGQLSLSSYTDSVWVQFIPDTSGVTGLATRANDTYRGEQIDTLKTRTKGVHLDNSLTPYIAFNDDETIYILQTSNELFFGNPNLFTTLTYMYPFIGELYTYDGTSTDTVRIVTSGNWKKVNAFNSVGTYTGCSVSASTDRITFNVTGGKCSVHFTFTGTTESGSDNIEFAVYKNGVIQNNLRGQNALTTTPGQISISGAITVNTDDYIEVYCRNLTDTDDVFIKHINLSVTKNGI